MFLGKLLVAATKKEDLRKGTIKGVCVVCNGETDYGLPLSECVSDNFTGWSYFLSGNCMCPECAFLFDDQIFRRKSWVASLSFGFKTFKNEEALKILFDPPEPPFFVHIAKIGQKQTWLTCIHRVALSKRNYFFSHEKYDVPILFDFNKAQVYVDVVRKALELGITKTELLSGEFHMKTWQKALEGGYRSFLHELAKFKGDILWEVIVDVYRRAG